MQRNARLLFKPIKLKFTCKTNLILLIKNIRNFKSLLKNQQMFKTIICHLINQFQRSLNECLSYNVNIFLVNSTMYVTSYLDRNKIILTY